MKRTIIRIIWLPKRDSIKLYEYFFFDWLSTGLLEFMQITFLKNLLSRSMQITVCKVGSCGLDVAPKIHFNLLQFLFLNRFLMDEWTLLTITPYSTWYPTTTTFVYLKKKIDQFTSRRKRWCKTTLNEIVWRNDLSQFESIAV